MSYTQFVLVCLSLSFFSCNSRQTETNFKVDSTGREANLDDTTQRYTSKDSSSMTDTFSRFTVDDYPISFEMMAEQKGDNSSSYKKISGKTQSLDKAWFTNDSLDQTLVFELYTDGHKLATFHFYNDDIPTELLQRLELHSLEGEMADMQQEKRDFPGFLKQSVRINSRYFKSDKGIELGDNKEKILNIYGNPDKTTVNKGVEKLEWNYVGDILYDGKEDLKGRPLAKNNYGHHAYLFFKNGKLIGQLLYNDIP